MAFVQRVDKGFFPLDEELELLPGGLSPHGYESLVRLAGWIPFKRAAEMFEDFMGIHVDKSTCRRCAEAAGKAYEDVQTEEVGRLEREMPIAPAAGAEKMQVSADGAMVPLVKGEWAEVRTVVIGEIQPKVEERGEWVVHARHLSYFSRKVNSDEFTRLALVEVQRRGLENAKEVGAVMDGSDWLQGFADYHCPKAVRILDFPHAGGHISSIGKFLHGDDTPEGKAWLSKRLHQLKHDGPTELLDEFRALEKEHPDETAVVGNLAYLEKRENQMQYPKFQAEGWPIGSGIVESGNKLVVEARLKGAGMHWAGENVNPMLALRNILCSDRWKADWPKVTAQLRRQTAQRQTENHRARIEAKTVLASNEPTQVMLLTEQAPIETPVEPIPFQPPKSPKDNPWRKFKFGKALYERSTSSKN
jgi:hypothetical protein